MCRGELFSPLRDASPDRGTRGSGVFAALPSSREPCSANKRLYVTRCNSCALNIQRPTRLPRNTDDAELTSGASRYAGAGVELKEIVAIDRQSEGHSCPLFVCSLSPLTPFTVVRPPVK
jgi:hypothetical protein